MRVAVYYPWVYLTSGVERVIVEMAKRSRHEYVIFTNHFDEKGTYPELESIEVVELESVSVSRDLLSVVRAALIILTEKIDLSSFDLLLVHSDGLGDLVLNRNGQTPVICLCHTPLRPVFDEHYMRKVLAKSGVLGQLAYKGLSRMYKSVDRMLWKKYDYVIFNGRETLSRARKGGLLGGVKGKFDVISPGVDWKKIKPVWKYEHYFLIAGRIMWTKNVELGIRAFVRFKKVLPNSEFGLVVAGQVDKKSQTYLKKLQAMVLGRDDVEFVVNPTDEKLAELYSKCWSLMSVSFNEDWGMTVLEASAHGKPVLAVNRGGPKETVIDGKTGFLLPLRAKAFSLKMAELAKDRKLVSELGKNARSHCEKYDWSYFVKRFDNLIEEIATNV